MSVPNNSSDGTMNGGCYHCGVVVMKAWDHAPSCPLRIWRDSYESWYRIHDGLSDDNRFLDWLHNYYPREISISESLIKHIRIINQQFSNHIPNISKRGHDGDESDLPPRKKCNLYGPS